MVITGERAETVRWTVGTKRYPTKQGASEAKALAREATMRLGRVHTPSCDNGNIQIINTRKSKLNKYYTERYRSGHNEAVLKTVWGQPHKGSNPFLSAIRE